MTKSSAKSFDVLPSFASARQMLKKRYKTPSEASKEVKDEIARTRMFQLFSNNWPDNSFTHRIQRRVISLIYKNNNSISEFDVYHWLSKRISHSPGEAEKRVVGEYRYWRSFKDDKHATIFKIRVGDLRIFERGGVLYYQHRSANAPDHIDWEDNGFAYVVGNRLYCIGFRTLNMRMFICHIPDDVATQAFHGIVLSVQNYTQKIFSAAFLMFHKSNASKYAILESGIDVDEFQKLSTSEPNMFYKIIFD